MAGEIHPMRAEAPGCAQRHGRVDTELPGHVVGGRHHTPLAAAHDHRLASERRVAILLHRGEEGVEVQMGYDPVRGSVRSSVFIPCLHGRSIPEHLFVEKG